MSPNKHVQDTMQRTDTRMVTTPRMINIFWKKHILKVAKDQKKKNKSSKGKEKKK